MGRRLGLAGTVLTSSFDLWDLIQVAEAQVQLVCPSGVAEVPRPCYGLGHGDG